MLSIPYVLDISRSTISVAQAHQIVKKSQIAKKKKNICRIMYFSKERRGAY